jgi:hypothetical protein
VINLLTGAPEGPPNAKAKQRSGYPERRMPAEGAGARFLRPPPPQNKKREPANWSVPPPEGYPVVCFSALLGGPGPSLYVWGDFLSRTARFALEAWAGNERGAPAKDSNAIAIGIGCYYGFE